MTISPKLSLTLAFKASCYRKLDFPIPPFEAADNAHTLDDDLHHMTGSSRLTTLRITDRNSAVSQAVIRLGLFSQSH